MSAFPEIGHSDHQEMSEFRGRFRPGAVIPGALCWFFDSIQKDLAPVEQSALRFRRRQAKASLDRRDNHDFTLGVRGGEQ